MGLQSEAFNECCALVLAWFSRPDHALIVFRSVRAKKIPGGQGLEKYWLKDGPGGRMVQALGKILKF